MPQNFKKIYEYKIPAVNANGVEVSGPPQQVSGGISGEILTSGSDLNRTAIGPWYPKIDAGTPVQVSWRRSLLKALQIFKVGATYGGRTSSANFQFRGREFDGIGNMPGPIPAGNRPMWNNLFPVLWGLRVSDPKSKAQPNELVVQSVIQSGPTAYQAPATASLSEVLQ